MLPPTFIFTKMIHFNELYITDDKQHIVIDVEIDDDPVYDYCDIDSITITLKDKCDKAEKQEVVYTNPTTDNALGPRRVRLCVPSFEHPLDMVKGSLSGHLFLVTVEANVKGNKAAITDMECGQDKYVIDGLAYDSEPIYKAALRYASSYGDTCDNNDASVFQDFILRYYAFDYALRCGEIDAACKYFNNYLMNNSTTAGSFNNGCGCHGTRRQFI